MYYLFKNGICEMMSGSRASLEEESVRLAAAEGTQESAEVKIIADERWLAPSDLYLDAQGNIAVRAYDMNPQHEIPAAPSPPVDEERLALYEALAAQETRIAELETALKGGEQK